MKSGWYTGKKLSDYNPTDFRNMRAIVNPGELKYTKYEHRVQKFIKAAEKWFKYLNSL